MNIGKQVRSASSTLTVTTPLESVSRKRQGNEAMSVGRSLCAQLSNSNSVLLKWAFLTCCGHQAPVSNHNTCQTPSPSQGWPMMETERAVVVAVACREISLRRHTTCHVPASSHGRSFRKRKSRVKSRTIKSWCKSNHNFLDESEVSRRRHSCQTIYARFLIIVLRYSSPSLSAHLDTLGGQGAGLDVEWMWPMWPVVC
ncbi:hypothetical protein ONE63_011248 [Megalurothrips usitatus]|uniref:Uncharacterized protein n=1 Tax=Megalurothrips usitatus TaxID=439358 RepID=A0AAV7WZU0_9NEOP|nr:hypothetical protein ONE63_011248 [Megalurothrips usitatus]